MGSVIDYIECPNCKQNNCFDDFNYKTGEEIQNCPDCGYHRSFKYKRNEEGVLIKKDETKGFEFDNLIMDEQHIEKPFGAFYVKSDSGGGVGGSLETQKDYQNFLLDVVNTANNKQGIELITVSRLINGEIKMEKLYEKG